MSDTTVVHLLRHGEVENPDHITYGRLPGYRLSANGRLMAEPPITSPSGPQVAADTHAGRAVAVCALDNLGKGAAGQAIQIASPMLGLPETAGLTACGVSP